MAGEEGLPDEPEDRMAGEEGLLAEYEVCHAPAAAFATEEPYPGSRVAATGWTPVTAKPC